MGQVGTNSIANYARLGFKPGEAGAQQMGFKTQESTHHQPDVVELAV